MSHTALSRIPPIDGLRAFAVAVVIAAHLFPSWFPGGGVGVSVFFVISGFVITAGLLKDYGKGTGIDVKQFYIRRIFRLWPALFAVVGFTFFAAMIGGKNLSVESAVALGSIMNWMRAFEVISGGPLGHTWSLAIEEQFYLLWPLCFILIMRRRSSAIPILLLAIIVVVLWRAWLTYTGASIDRLYNGTDTRIDGLLIGCLLAFSARRLPQWAVRAWFVPVIFLLAVVVTDQAGPAVGYLLVSLCSAWLLLVAAEDVSPLHPLLNSTLAQWGGSRSYSLYLWHYPLLVIMDRLPASQLVKAPAILIFTLLAAEASYRFVEQPLRYRYRHFLTGRPAQQFSSREASGTTPGH